MGRIRNPLPPSFELVMDKQNGNGGFIMCIFSTYAF